jgi:aminopeptidase N
MNLQKYISRYLCAILLVSLHYLPAAAQQVEDIAVVKGVSWELAQHRKKTISDINYNLDVSIPLAMNKPIRTLSEISFKLSDISQDLQLDFSAESEKLITIKVNGRRVNIDHCNEHIIINRERLKLGKNKVRIDFEAGEGALKRTPAFVYTLFVPDRMRTSFPSFDQPNLKATFELSLSIPGGWEAMSAAEIRSRSERISRSKIHFKKSNLMSTYLFSFVAGNFEKITKSVGGMEMTMMHREIDSAKARNNVDDIFRHHKAAIDYMEEYTGIKYPFDKFGFVLIPSFQFGGMEHIGSIHYKSETLMLDENPAPVERLIRASLIGHETAHMWFGDLVTMDWFNDVWTKEVFANFMSAKLVSPSFPDIDHQLRAHLRLHPGAYSVDRSPGTNPIRQELPNLNEAGSMYGDIIYNKAPIMMQQLELLLGEDKFRDGIREYLQTYALKNATWPDLIALLDKYSDVDVKNWSDVWVNTPGRPVFEIENKPGGGLLLSQYDPQGMDRTWAQNFDLKRGPVPYNITVNGEAVNLDSLGNTNDPTILPNSNGMGYGLFPISKNFIRDNWDTLSSLEKASAFVNLYEHLLEANGTITPREYVDLVLFAIEREENTLIINHLMRQLVSIYWSLFTTEARLELAPAIENAIWQQINNDKHDIGVKRIYVRNYADIALTEQALVNVRNIWTKKPEYEYLKLGVGDYTNMAAFLAIKLPGEADTIIKTQMTNVDGLDSQRRWEFLQYSLSPKQDIRDKFFQALEMPQNRTTEAWVLSALEYLHHPLRNGASEKYLQKSLEMVQDIQITGDIFFPGRWLASSFRYYQSDSAVQTVNNFLRERPDYNYQLRLKILQETDLLMRANKILYKKS